MIHDHSPVLGMAAKSERDREPLKSCTEERLPYVFFQAMIISDRRRS